jgi:hypothetical protein
MFNAFDIKRIVVTEEKGEPEAVAMVEFSMDSAKPDMRAFKLELKKWMMALHGQKTLDEAQNESNDATQ